MATANPILGDDTVLQVNDGASSAFVDIDDVTDLTPPGPMRPHIDRKILNNAGVVQRTPGSRMDFDKFTFSVEKKGSTNARLDALLMPAGLYTPGGTDPRSFSWKIKHPDGATDTFPGSVESIKPGPADSGVIAVNTVTVVLQGPITRAYVAATSIPINPDA